MFNAFSKHRLPRLLAVVLAGLAAGIAAEPAHGRARPVPQDQAERAPRVARLVLVAEPFGSPQSLIEAARVFESDPLPELWQDHRATFVRASSDEGRALVSEYGLRGAALLALDAGGELLAARSSVTNLAYVARWVGELSRGEGTLDDLRARIAADPQDTTALYELARTQRAVDTEGDPEATVAAIRAADPDAATPAGRAVELALTFERHKRGTPLEATELAQLEELASAAPASWVRCQSYMALAHIASIGSERGRASTYALEAWRAAPAAWRPEVALALRRSHLWPAENTADAKLWSGIARVAAAAAQRFEGAPTQGR